MPKTIKWVLCIQLISTPLFSEQAPEPSTSLTDMNPDRHSHIRGVLGRYPAPSLPGVDLAWHIDRGIEYVSRVVNRKNRSIPFYGNRVAGTALLTHSDWDVPHCVGRFLDVVMLWEETSGKRFGDEKLIHDLRRLLHDSVSSQDHQSHFPPGVDPYGKGPGGDVDWHSQREVVLALIGLIKMRDDQKSLTLATKLIGNYEKRFTEWSSGPDIPLDVVLSGRFIEAAIDLHRLTANPVALEVARNLSDGFYNNIFDDKGKFPGPTNNQSGIQTVDSLIEFGIYTNQARFVLRMKKVIDHGLNRYRTSTGLFFADVGPLMEANCSADIIKAEILLGLNGYPEYLDDAERILRNGLLASQYLDPTLPEKNVTGKDSDQGIYTNAAERALGGFAFALPNDMNNVAADMVGGALHGLLHVWKNIVTRHEEGLRINFLFSKLTPDLEIYSYIPVRGQVDLKVIKPENVFVRVPGYVELENLELTVDGKKAPKRMFGPYVLIPRQKSASEISIRFPQKVKTETETIQGFKEATGKKYRVEWLGDTVWNVTPHGKRPLFFPARLGLYGVNPQTH